MFAKVVSRRQKLLLARKELKLYEYFFSGLSTAQNLLYELNKDLEAIRNLPLNGDSFDVSIDVMMSWQNYSATSQSEIFHSVVIVLM